VVLDVLKEILTENQIQAVEADSHPLGNHAPYMVFPHSEQEIAAILSMANERSLKVIPMSGGTKRGFGGIEEKGDILLSLSSLKGIVEHSVGDMTMTVLPGTTMIEITDELAKVQQMVPLDPYLPEHATIGGIIASNDSGPKRLRYGSARDHVIGMRIVYPDGRIIRTGGKVVKNVAGYDMNKLFIGSMGTLGVISEITMKLRPLPKYSSLVLLTFPEDDCDTLQDFVVRLLDSSNEPVALEILSPILNERLNQKQGFGLAIAFEDVEPAVHAQEDWVQTYLPQTVEQNILQQDDAKDWWRAFSTIPLQDKHPNQHTHTTQFSDSIHYTDLNQQSTVHHEQIHQHQKTDQGKYEDIDIALKIGSKNQYVLELVQLGHQLALEHHVHVQAHGGVGHGISRVYVRGTLDRLTSFVQSIRSKASELGGYVIVQHAPLAFRREIQVWGEKPAYFPLIEGIKQTIDPNQVLNDKRFVGGV
jgi:glycolate oxidase FAD binding subunit